jgi:hypothetical protein
MDKSVKIRVCQIEFSMELARQNFTNAFALKVLEDFG